MNGVRKSIWLTELDVRLVERGRRYLAALAPDRDAPSDSEVIRAALRYLEAKVRAAEEERGRQETREVTNGQ